MCLQLVVNNKSSRDSNSTYFRQLSIINAFCNIQQSANARQVIFAELFRDSTKESFSLTVFGLFVVVNYIIQLMTACVVIATL